MVYNSSTLHCLYEVVVSALTAPAPARQSTSWARIWNNDAPLGLSANSEERTCLRSDLALIAIILPTIFKKSQERINSNSHASRSVASIDICIHCLGGAKILSSDVNMEWMMTGGGPCCQGHVYSLFGS